MKTPEQVRPGGLMRCCMASLQEAREPATEAPMEGDRVKCKYCQDGMMVYSDGAWQWDKPLLFMWTIYDHPTDYPDDYVARRFIMDRPTSKVMLSKDIEELREAFRTRGLMVIPRAENDDSKIVEVWM